MLSPPNEIIHNAKRNHRKRHQHAVIHVLSRHRRERRPEAPEQHEEYVDARVDVVDHAEDPGQVPRAPGELGLGDFARGIGGGEPVKHFRDGLGVVAGVGRVRLHLPCRAAPEEKGAGDEVGCVEAGGGEGDDVFEDGGGPNVDEGEEGGYDGHEGDGDYGD